MSAQVKAMLRRESRRRRNAIPERAARSAAICERVATLPAYRSARVLHCYLPIRSEVDTRPLLLTSLARGTGVVVPVVRPDVNELAHSWVASLAAEDLEVGTFGTLQPRLLQPAEVGVWDLVIVPLLAFDRAGYRLGYGKGFYDRLLTSAPATTIGLAFAAQEAPRIPHEPHDMPLDLIVTEDEVIAAGAGGE
ncbi:MAG: 5-formyltetrahydrofolate cyclo-ligase [Chloroflexaceae bacterium]